MDSDTAACCVAVAFIRFPVLDILKAPSFISSNLIHNSYIKLNASTFFGRHLPILRRSMSLVVHVCSLWYSHSLQVAVLCTC